MPPTSYTTDASRAKTETEDSYTKDPTQRATALKNAINDAQDLIGKIIRDTSTTAKPFTTMTIIKTHNTKKPENTKFDCSKNNHTQIHPPTEPLMVASTTPQQAPKAELPMLIADIVNKSVPTPSATAFQFQLTPEAAAHNTKVLSKYNYNLEQAIIADGNSPLRYGSEFRPLAVLEPLLKHHPNWPFIVELLSTGFTFIADPLSEPDRRRQLDLAMEFGNHKGAQKNPHQLRQLLIDDVTHGFNLPVTIDLVNRILGLVLSPMNIAKQNTIDEIGRIIEKDRLTHDHSHEFFPGSSINKRCRQDLHQTCMFGKALSRMIHWIVYMRRKYPLLRILLTKTDWKAAYRRAHLELWTAVQCATHLSDTLLIPLRMTFGGAPCPAGWSCISDTACDLATDLANHPDWDPRKLKSPHQHLLREITAETESKRPPPKQAEELLFDFPEEEEDHIIKFDNYIDDLLGAGVEVDDDAVRRLSAAGSLVIHTLGRPVDKDDPIPRDDLNSLKKLSAEGLPEESRICLGITLDTYLLTAALPKHKYKAWSNSIRAVMKAGHIGFHDLEELIGRLEHINQIQQPGRHFLGRLRALLYSFGLHPYGTRHLGREIFKDLELWLKLLKRATTGVSLNLLVHRNPTNVYRTDASLHGLGGYSDRGRAWRFEIPKDLRGRATINLLEYIGTFVSPWVDFLEGNLEPEASILAESDNATASAWCHKSNFESEQRPTHLKVSRKFAVFLLESKTQLVNEWLAGRRNQVADSLSRDTHLPPDIHADLLRAHFPLQIPIGFLISPLPAEISSWICSILESLPERAAISHKSTRSALVSGTDGLPIWPTSTKPTIHFWNNSTVPNRPPPSSPSSLEDSPKHFDLVNCNKEARKAWLVEQSEVTWTAWYRPSGLTGSQTQHSTVMESFRRFYRGKSPVSKV
jgi:hypothetical protein